MYSRSFASETSQRTRMRSLRDVGASELELVKKIAQDPQLRAELEKLHHLELECNGIIEEMKNRKLTVRQRSAACQRLRRLIDLPDGVWLVHSCGGTEALCELLRGGQSAEKKVASSVLARLASEELCRSTIAYGGTLDSLCHMLKTSNHTVDDDSRGNAALCIANLCAGPGYSTKVANLAVDPSLCRQLALHHSDPVKSLMNIIKVTILEAGGIQTALHLLATFEPEAFEDSASQQGSPKRSEGSLIDDEYSFDSDMEESYNSDGPSSSAAPPAHFSHRIRRAILERAKFITNGSRCGDWLWREVMGGSGRCIGIKNSAFLGGAGTLHVRLMQCKSLPRMDVGRLFLPTQRRRKVVEDSLDPIFEEDFTFDIINCANQKLSLRAMDFDDIDEEEEEIRFNKLDGKADESNKNATDKAGSIHDFIGSLQIDLKVLLAEEDFVLEVQECGGVPALLDILHSYEHTSPIGSNETIRELLLMIHNRDVSNPNNLSHIYAGKCLAVLASEPEVRQHLLEAGAVDVFSEWLDNARAEGRKLDAEVAGLCLYAMSLNNSAAQRMKKGTLESLLSVFDISSSAIASDKTQACAVPALINICLGHVR
ncbi:hypothetical protein GUITHDRAFT_141736 [Guillardia theta CCMP2712]|uniref:C2 domain-containing protein n=1 Tax=Guillardia theta (strain CCMP2712) TaxID=905079 RepID=L1IZR5_GUITC|nr:hypothetical protein GUITHDRAFT_141736 [Guillardia theta CCMP2712]EKX41736.1 hypothetical protein GUITHDRAFT_141736 [Guillardia theta CCMP2712]|eukprot:XP_005828716.1 hypothetical protein GUITHDRAFT_141736 [Guillardia theta CCMP2712]